MWHWKSAVGFASVITLIMVGHGFAVDPPKKPTIMQRRLQHSQSVLEGLALKDFARIKTGADGMMDCAKEASWRVLTTPKYELYSNDFIRHLEEMKTAANNKNLDAATLAYVETTLICIKCHQHVRDERMGLAPLPENRLTERNR